MSIQLTVIMQTMTIYLFLAYRSQQISSKNFVLLVTFNLEHLYIELWFIDQNFIPLEKEDKVIVTLPINYSVTYNLEIEYL